MDLPEVFSSLWSCGGCRMKHDLEDMLEIIKRLEERIILLERAVGSITSPISEDRWYWLH